MTTLLTAAQILLSQDLVTENVKVPEWGGVVRLRTLSAGDAIEMIEEMRNPANENNGMFIALVRCAVDEEGNPLFTHDQIPELKKKNIRVLDRLQKAALRLNRMRDDAEVAAKNV